METDLVLTVSGTAAAMRAFDAAGGTDSETPWVLPGDHTISLRRFKEGARHRFGTPGGVFEPEVVAAARIRTRQWFYPGCAPDQFDTLCTTLSGQFPELTMTAISSTETSYRVRTFIAGTCRIQDELPGDVWVRLFLPERAATVHIRPAGPSMPMHAAELSAHLRVSVAKSGKVPATVLLNHEIGTHAARFRFDLHVRRATGADTNVMLLDDALQATLMPGLPARRAVALTVPLSTRVRTFAEAVRRRPDFCTHALPLLRELACTPLPGDELTRYAVELTDTTNAPALLQVLPPLAALTPGTFEELVAALDDTTEAYTPEEVDLPPAHTSIADVVGWLQSLLLPASKGPGADGSAPDGRAAAAGGGAEGAGQHTFAIPEARSVAAWRDLRERVFDALAGIAAPQQDSVQPNVLIIDLENGKYLQYLAGEGGLVAEVSGPSRIQEGGAWIYGERVYLYFNGRPGELLAELGYDLDSPEANFRRFYDTDEAGLAAEQAMRIIEEVFREDYPGWVRLELR